MWDKLTIKSMIRNISIFFVFIILAATIIVLFTVDIQSDNAIRLAVISTFFVAISSIATFIQAEEARRQREDAERPEVGVFFNLKI